MHNWYSEITPKENRRVAYTTLFTQANEPFLLCPKGKFQGFKSPIPMEISKCRENCIDSRVDKSGHVTCAYQDWLKVAFQSHDEVMARLDVHKHPDNEANALELKEGERSKKLTEGEIGFEARFDNSDRGANKIRDKHNLSDSMEKQLSEKEATFYKINRGGDITYHGPGQIVGYPILDLDNFFTDIHKYLRFLEQAVINTLSEYDIKASISKGETGVWVKDNNGLSKKVCAFGIRASRWVTMHGFCFNINPELNYFKNIIPCGIKDKGVTSVSELKNNIIKINEIKEVLYKNFAQSFEAELVYEN